MVEPASDSPPQQRRANWVALRTIRQRPKHVGATPSGEPVYQAKSVRLVLPTNADHFVRLEECSKCGKEVAGKPVLTPADLHRSSHTVICRDCVRASALHPAHERQGRRAAAPAPPAPEGAERAQEPVATEDDGRLVALEARLDGALVRLDEMAGSQRHDGAVSQRLADVIEKAEAALRRIEVLEDEQRRGLDRLGGLLESQRRELGVLAGASAAARDDITVIKEAQEHLASAGHDVQRRLADLAARVTEGQTAPVPTPDLEGRVAELGRLIEGLRSDMQTSLAPAVDELARAQREHDARLAHVLQWSQRAQAQLDASASVAPALERWLESSLGEMAAQVEGLRRNLNEQRVVTQPGPPEFKVPGTSGLLDELDRQLADAEGRLARRLRSRPAP